MKRVMSILLAFMLLFVMACSDNGSDGDNEQVNEFNVLTDYLEDGDPTTLAWVNNMSGWIKDYSDVKDNLSEYLVIDIRAADDYDAYHLPDAVHSTIPGVFDKAASSKERILVVCYSGQSAAYAHMLLRLKGYEAYSLKFGMSSVRAENDVWTGKCSNQFADHENWVKTESPDLPTFDYPELSTDKESGEAILEDRITEAANTWGDRTISSGDVVDNPESFNIICYWPESDYMGYGHIDGAYRVDPNTLTRDGNLSVFDPAGNNVFYCYTGQTAAASIAYLKVVGYDVKSIVYGANNMIYDEMTGHKWPKPYGG